MEITLVDSHKRERGEDEEEEEEERHLGMEKNKISRES